MDFLFNPTGLPDEFGCAIFHIDEKAPSIRNYAYANVTFNARETGDLLMWLFMYGGQFSFKQYDKDISCEEIRCFIEEYQRVYSMPSGAWLLLEQAIFHYYKHVLESATREEKGTHGLAEFETPNVLDVLFNLNYNGWHMEFLRIYGEYDLLKDIPFQMLTGAGHNAKIARIVERPDFTNSQRRQLLAKIKREGRIYFFQQSDKDKAAAVTEFCDLLTERYSAEDEQPAKQPKEAAALQMSATQEHNLRFYFNRCQTGNTQIPTRPFIDGTTEDAFIDAVRRANFAGLYTKSPDTGKASQAAKTFAKYADQILQKPDRWLSSIAKSMGTNPRELSQHAGDVHIKSEHSRCEGSKEKGTGKYRTLTFL